MNPHGLIVDDCPLRRSQCSRVDVVEEHTGRMQASRHALIQRRAQDVATQDSMYSGLLSEKGDEP